MRHASAWAYTYECSHGTGRENAAAAVSLLHYATESTRVAIDAVHGDAPIEQTMTGLEPVATEFHRLASALRLVFAPASTPGSAYGSKSHALSDYDGCLHWLCKDDRPMLLSALSAAAKALGLLVQLAERVGDRSPTVLDTPWFASVFVPVVSVVKTMSQFLLTWHTTSTFLWDIEWEDLERWNIDRADVRVRIYLTCCVARANLRVICAGVVVG